jgi:hypothetical protein
MAELQPKIHGENIVPGGIELELGCASVKMTGTKSTPSTTNRDCQIAWHVANTGHNHILPRDIQSFHS